MNKIDTERYQPARQNMKCVARSLHSIANKLHIMAQQANIFSIILSINSHIQITYIHVWFVKYRKESSTTRISHIHTIYNNKGPYYIHFVQENRLKLKIVMVYIFTRSSKYKGSFKINGSYCYSCLIY